MFNEQIKLWVEKKKLSRQKSDSPEGEAVGWPHQIESLVSVAAKAALSLLIPSDFGGNPDHH